MFVYAGNPKALKKTKQNNDKKNFPELINNYAKATEYKVNV